MQPRPCLALFMAAVLAAAPERASGGISASEATTLALLDKLRERDLPDVMLWVIERAAAAPDCSADTRRRLDFLKGSALISESRRAADSASRIRLLDEAEQAIDAFLASSPADAAAIDAFTQKGSLLVERGRLSLALAQRPGADEAAQAQEAVAFFDRAIKTLRTAAGPPRADGKEPPPAPEIPATIQTAEDAVLRSLRDVASEIDRIRMPLKDIQAQQDAKQADLAPLQKEIAAIDAEIRQRQAQIPPIQAELVELQKPPGPRSRSLSPQEMQERRLQAGHLTGRLQAIMGEIAALEAKKQKPEAQARRLTAEKARIAKQVTTAEKPLERELEEPLQRQEELRTRLLQTRLLVAETCFEKSKAHPPGSPGWQAALEESLRLNHELAEKYGTLGVGFMARLNEGRCQALLGQRDAAIATLAPLVTLEATPGQPLSPLGLSLKTKALGIVLPCWLEEKKFGEVTGPTPFEPDQYRGNPFLRFALAPAKAGQLTPEMAAVKYHTAALLAARAKADADKEPHAAKVLEADAAKLAREVSTANRELAKEARELATALGKTLGTVAGDFPALMADGQAAYRGFQEAQAAAKAARSAGDDAATAASIERVTAAREEALGAMRAALALGEQDPAADDAAVNQVRSILAFLLYDAGDHAAAAALGSLLVKDHPNAPSSRQAARVALASLQALAAGGDADAKARLRELASLVVMRWGDGAEAADATTILINLAAEAHDGAALMALADGLNPAMPRRPELLARAAVPLRREAEATRTSGGDPERAAAWEAAARRAIDEALPAVDASGSLPADATAARAVVTAALVRAQMALADGDRPLAIALLTNGVSGPWTLVSSGDAPEFTRGPLATSTLTIALNAFVEDQRFDDAHQAMALLERDAGSGDEAASRLSVMYQALGRSLQQRLEQVAASGGADAATRAAPLLAGFETFLDGVASRDPKTAAQLWVATTYQALGSGTSTVVPQAKAGQYLDRAAAAYARLLDRMHQPGLAEAEAAELRRVEPTVRLRIAALSRERGAWQAAQEQIDALLADPQRQNWLDAQTEAAELLLAAGRAAAAAGDTSTADERLREAVSGRQSPSVIWGWSGIATKVSRQAFASADAKALQARDVFFRARLRVAECLQARAAAKADATDKAAALAAAENSIAMTRRLYPDLGGPTLQRQFEALLKSVQTASGKPADGFAGLEAMAPAP